MRPVIVILEDNPERVDHMRPVLREQLPQFEHLFFATAPEMIAWLKEGLSSVVFLSLDNDLDSVVPRHVQAFDPGCGLDVVDYLAVMLPVCPVFVHTSNQYAGDAMVRRLRDGDWHVFRVYPRDDMKWIEADWAADLRNLVQRGLIFS